MQRRGRQDDGWIPEARMMRQRRVPFHEIATRLGVSRFRVMCALNPNFRENSRQAVRAARASRAAAARANRDRTPSAPRPLTQSELDE